jgi:hypothetical protein
MKLNLDYVCYISWPFVGELYFPSRSGIIPNVANDLILFMYHFHRFEYVPSYMKYVKKPGQMHYEILQSIKYNQEDWDGIF